MSANLPLLVAKPTPTDVSRALCLMAPEGAPVIDAQVAVMVDLVQRYGWDSSFRPALVDTKPRSGVLSDTTLLAWLARRKPETGQTALVRMPPLLSDFESWSVGPSPRKDFVWFLGWLVAMDAGSWMKEPDKLGSPFLQECLFQGYWSVVCQLLSFPGAPSFRQVLSYNPSASMGGYFWGADLARRDHTNQASPSPWPMLLDFDPTFVPTPMEAALGSPDFFDLVKNRLPRTEEFANEMRDEVLKNMIETFEEENHVASVAKRVSWLFGESEAAALQRASDWMVPCLLSRPLTPYLVPIEQPYSDNRTLMHTFLRTPCLQAACLPGSWCPLAAIVMHHLATFGQWHAENDSKSAISGLDLKDWLGGVPPEQDSLVWSFETMFAEDLPLRGLLALVVLGAYSEATEQRIGCKDLDLLPRGWFRATDDTFDASFLEPHALAFGVSDWRVWADAVLDDAITVTNWLRSHVPPNQRPGLSLAWLGILDRYPQWFQGRNDRVQRVLSAVAGLPVDYWSGGELIKDSAATYAMGVLVDGLLQAEGGVWCARAFEAIDPPGLQSAFVQVVLHITHEDHSLQGDGFSSVLEAVSNKTLCGAAAVTHLQSLLDRGEVKQPKEQQSRLREALMGVALPFASGGPMATSRL